MTYFQPKPPFSLYISLPLICFLTESLAEVRAGEGHSGWAFLNFFSLFQTVRSITAINQIMFFKETTSKHDLSPSGMIGKKGFFFSRFPHSSEFFTQFCAICINRAVSQTAPLLSHSVIKIKLAIRRISDIIFGSKRTMHPLLPIRMKMHDDIHYLE